MNEVENSPKPLGQQGKDLADTAASKVQGGVQSVQQATNKAIDETSHEVDDVKNNVSSTLEKASDQAQQLVQHGRELFNDTSKMMRDKATQASELAVEYAQDEPVRAILVAAAIGAMLMGLVVMMAGRRD